MSLFIEKETDTDFSFDEEALAKEVTDYAIEHEGFPFEAEINLTLTDNDGIHAINKEYRDIDAPTDPDTGEIMLGDIIISVDKVKEQAKSYGHSEKREYAFLILHSMLHLFGYDHMTPEEAAIMEGKQTEILNEMNILR